MASRQDHRANFDAALNRLAAAGGKATAKPVAAKPAGTRQPAAASKPGGKTTVATLPSGVVIHAKDEHCAGAGVHYVRMK